MDGRRLSFYNYYHNSTKHGYHQNNEKCISTYVGKRRNMDLGEKMALC